MLDLPTLLALSLLVENILVFLALFGTMYGEANSKWFFPAGMEYPGSFGLQKALHWSLGFRGELTSSLRACSSQRDSTALQLC